MTTQQALEAKRREAFEKFKTVTPRNPPIIGIHCEHWPRNECCYKTTREAMQSMQAMRNTR